MRVWCRVAGGVTEQHMKVVVAYVQGLSRSPSSPYNLLSVSMFFLSRSGLHLSLNGPSGQAAARSPALQREKEGGVGKREGLRGGGGGGGAHGS